MNTAAREKLARMTSTAFTTDFQKTDLVAESVDRFNEIEQAISVCNNLNAENMHVPVYLATGDIAMPSKSPRQPDDERPFTQPVLDRSQTEDLYEHLRLHSVTVTPDDYDRLNEYVDSSMIKSDAAIGAIRGTMGGHARSARAQHELDVPNYMFTADHQPIELKDPRALADSLNKMARNMENYAHSSFTAHSNNVPFEPPTAYKGL